MDYSLVLTFLTTSGEKATLTIGDVRSDLTSEEVTTLATTILQQAIFTSKNGDLASFHSAKLNEKRSTFFDIQID